MNKFLTLCEEFDPTNSTNHKLHLKEFLNSKGITASLIRDTNMLYISTDDIAVAVEVIEPEEEEIGEEDAENLNAGYGSYSVNDEVENLASKANSGLKGVAAKVLGGAGQKAKSAVKKRQNVAKKAVDVYDRKTQQLQNDLKNVR